MLRRRREWSVLVLASLLACSTLAAACAGRGVSVPLVAGPSAPDGVLSATPHTSPGKYIKHVVIIVQENRSFDSLFHGYRGADYATTGMTDEGQQVKLQPVSFAAPYELSHSHRDAYNDCNGNPPGENCKMNGFDDEPAIAERSHTPPPNPQYVYVPNKETRNYFNMAHDYVLSDRFFSSQLDASYVGHQYLIAAWAGMAIDIPNAPPWGCDAPKGTTVQLVDSHDHPTKSVFPCFMYESLGNQLDAKRISWRYYAPSINIVSSGALWSAYDAIDSIRHGPDWTTNVISPQCQILTDVAAKKLSTVTWVIPNLSDSDHPESNSTSGPNWVAAVVNAIGKSAYWDSTAIFLTWDDWGGFYDHVPPPHLDYDGLGFRVPFIAIGAYAKKAYIARAADPNHPYEFGSILHSIEGLLGLKTMQASDQRAPALWKDMFDFGQSARKFTAFPTHGYTCSPSLEPPPDEY